MLDPVVTLLAKQSAKSLREMDDAITGQIDDLATQRAWIRRALAEKGIGPEGDAETDKPSAPTNGNGARPGRKRGDKRHAITELMQTDAGRVWLPSEIREGLAARGMDVTVAAVRVTMRRMGDDGELVRPDDGNGWLLATTGATPGAPSSEGPSATDLNEASTPV
jgi:hypothetical protein